MTERNLGPYWSNGPDELAATLRSGAQGLTSMVSTLVLVMVTFAIPFLPFASLVGFVPLSPLRLATIAAVTLAYVAATEPTRGWFYHAHH